MENIKDIKDKVQSSISNITDKGKLLVTKTVSLEGKQVYKKIFDNMIWVFVLVGVLILVYLSYLLTNSFNIDRTIATMNREYEVKKIVSLNTPSASGQEEKYDEIDVEKHSLSDTFICSSAKSYLSGRQLFDYVSKQMFFQNIKLGARYVELDLFENKDGNIVVSNGIFDGNWRLTINDIFFEDFCREIPTKVFNKEYTSNYQDPFIIFLGLNIDKKKMNLVSKIIEDFMGKSLLGKKYVVSGKENLLKLNIKDLMGKIIIVTDGKIANTDLLNTIHLRVGAKVRKLSYSELILEDRERLKDFNKHHITIITPDPNISSLNYNPELAFDCGCQIISMNFQYVGDHMKAYLSKFREKSFTLKPFEFTSFSDIPQRGYDPNKIAYYNNYEILNEKTVDGTEAGTEAGTGTKADDYRKDDDSIFFKNKLGVPSKENLREGCCKLFIDDEDVEHAFHEDYDISIPSLLNKISELGENPDRMVSNIDQATSQDELKDIASILTISPSPSASINPQELKYNVLLKQVKKILQQKREEIFKSGMKDPCVSNIKEDKCNNNPLCYMEMGPSDSKCESQLSNIPFPKLCVPKYISPNRNMCLSSEKDTSFIDSKGMRQLFHEKMTQPGFAGKWNSYLGPITISDEFNSQCEFSFKTKHDDKEFTLFMVHWDTGSYFNSVDDNFIGNDNTYKLRAKGTFIDPMLRRTEKKNNLPEMPYHGYVEMKMDDYTEKNYLSQCKNNKFIGIYRYSDKVYKKDDETSSPEENKIKSLYTELIDKTIDDYSENGMVLGYDRPFTTNTSPNIYCYKILSNECLDENLGPAISFVSEEIADPPGIYAPAEEVFATDKLLKMTEKMGLEFTAEELDTNPKLRERIIGLVQVERPELIEEVEQEIIEEKQEELERKELIKSLENKKEVVVKANLFIYHISSSASATLKKPGDAFRIMGPNNVPYCIQRKMADFSINECDNGKCDVSTAYIGPCKNSPVVEDPFCSNIDAAHNIQFVDDGTTGDNRTQTIRFLNTGTGSNPVDACLSYNEEGKVVYANCVLNKNADDTVKNDWKVYKKKGDTKFKLTSADGRCLTRTPYGGKKPEELERGLYQREAVIDTLFASTRLEECSDKLKDHQEFDIKYMGDVQNCEGPNDMKSMTVVKMDSISSPRDGLKYVDGEKIL